MAAFPPGPHVATEFRANYHTDFGRYIVAEPAVVLRPASVDQLAATLRALRDHALPYKIRGAAHSSGGQVVSRGGAVVDVTGLSGVVADAGTTVDALGGTRWIEIAEHLHPRRRPPVMTDNLRTTVAGTLAVGGFGDTTMRYGLQAASVAALDWVAPDGTITTLGPDDERFGYVLCGRGVLGAIARARLEVIARPPLLAGHLVAWRSLEEFLLGARVIHRDQRYEFVRAMLLWNQGGAVRAILANFTDGDVPRGPGVDGLGAAEAIVLPPSDRLVHARQDPIERWHYVCPALELALPLDERGRAAWGEIAPRVMRSGLAQHLPDGSAVVVVPGHPRLPLAPVPSGEAALLVALRPQLARPEDAAHWLPLLRELAAIAIAHGGRIYLISVEPDDPRFVEAQFGTAVVQRWRQLKAEVDPDGLCNPGLLPGTEAPA